MAHTFQNVQPGDLIAADFINQVLAELNSLENRVTALEGSATGGSNVIVTDLIPPSGNVKVGDELRVIGRNFAFSLGGEKVFIDETPINAFKPGTSDFMLIFDVPLTITDVPQGGRPALLTVSNLNSSAQRTLFLQPGVSLIGIADVTLQGIQPPTVNAGLAAIFTYHLRSRANLTATYALSATIDVANPAAWLANLQFLDSNQNPLPSNQLTVDSGKEVTFLVRINPVPIGTNGVQFGLTVNANAPGSSGSSGASIQTVGNPADQPDTTITPSFSSFQVNPAGAGTVTATQIQLNSGAAALVRFSVSFKVAGSYQLTQSLIAPATNWTAVPLSSSTPNPFPIAAGEIGAGGSVIKTLEFVVTRGVGATAGKIEFKIQLPGNPLSRRITMDLVAP